jgi:putative Holliday junction resolvase
VLPVPVETVDERLTTVSAERSLRDLQVKGKARRAVVDQVAAAILLQVWLDARPVREGVGGRG